MGPVTVPAVSCDATAVNHVPYRIMVHCGKFRLLPICTRLAAQILLPIVHYKSDLTGISMRHALLISVLGLSALLAGCKTETFPDPALSAKDVQLLALTPAFNRNQDPFRARQRMKDNTGQAPGTIVIDSDSKFLYFVEGNGSMLRYEISVGAQEFTWRGDATVRRKADWPQWVPMEEARKLNPALPKVVLGGPDNPLGARALYLHDENGKDTYIRIHGTNEPEYIGQNVSLGCIRMHNVDVIDLAERVTLGAKVVVR
jgi:lipoprotein-anchoring transpeptidase ErfK/SrfK